MERNFGKLFLLVVAIQLLLAYFFPITSDEAYFYSWAHQLDFNYYDHPPMTGWIVYGLTRLGRHVFFPRLFSIGSGIVVSAGIYQCIRRYFQDEVKARLLALLYLFSPMHVLFVIIATDTPLLMFLFLSGYCLFKGIRQDKGIWVFVSGLFWGGAVLSKYFAALFLIAVFIFFCQRTFQRREKAAWRQALLWSVGAAPLVLLHLYWNYQHCWTNLMFNVVSRNRNASFSLLSFLSFLGFQIYLAMPWVLYGLLRDRRTVWQGIRGESRLFFFLYSIPILLFALVAFHHTGLHWTIAFYPFFFLLAVYLERDTIRRLVRYTAVCGGLHVFLITLLLVLFAVRIEWLHKAPYYHDLVLALHGDEIYQVLKAKYGQADVMATNGYYTSGAMAYHSGRRFIVFHDDSKHGRQDDRMTDFRELDGKNILIFSTLPVEEDYHPYFEQLIQDTISVRQKTFYVAYGEGFRYPVYRALFLKQILDRFYTLPGILPLGDCFFYRKYFPERCGGACAENGA